MIFQPDYKGKKMNKYIITCIAILAGMVISSCRTGEHNVSDADKLTPDETKILVKCARYFLEKEAKKFKLTGDDLYVINYTYPKVRFQYTGHKEGRMFIKWSIYRKDQKISTENRLKRRLYPPFWKGI